MNRRLSLTLVAGAVLALTVACGGGEGDTLEAAQGRPVTLTDHGANAVSLWSQVGATTINQPAAASGTPEERAPNAFFDMPTLHVAIYDAVVAISRSHAPFMAPVADEPGLGSLPADAAVHAAAHGVLSALFPSRAVHYQATYDAAVAALPAGAATARALEIGRDVARRVVAARADDGRLTPLAPHVPGTAPGEFRGVNPIGRTNPFMRPFAILSASQFRADGPPALTSAEYAADFNEVKAYASATSSLRTPEQTESARFHTEPPPFYATRNLRRFATSQPTLAGNARMMAMLWVAQADVSIGCFETKYHYNFWRPTSAIRFADTDANAATEADPAWTPVVTTPNHPEYPAAHLCATSAAAETIKQVFGTAQVSFSYDSTVTGSTHHYTSVNDLTREVADARVHGGMHFRTSTVHGEVLGMQTAKYIAHHHFKALK